MILHLKKVTLTFFLFIIIFSLWAQSPISEINYRKFEFELSATAAGAGAYFSPALGYASKKHAICVAALKGSLTNGVLLGYKFYPNLRVNRANLYFSYNTFLTRRDVKSKYNYTYYHQYFIYYFSNTVGYGFDLRLLEEIYLMSEIGIGVHKRWDNETNVNKDILFEAMFKIGLKKRFRKK